MHARIRPEFQHVYGTSKETRKFQNVKDETSGIYDYLTMRNVEQKGGLSPVSTTSLECEKMCCCRKLKITYSLEGDCECSFEW